MRGTNEFAGKSNDEQGSVRGEPRLFGVYVGHVIDIQDPEGLGRVRVTIPSLSEPGHMSETWARLATLFAGIDRGSWFIPDVEDEVLVAFEAGDLRSPFVVGSLWNGSDRPPASANPAGASERKVIRSRTGLQISLVDHKGQAHVVIETPDGQKIVLRDGPGAIEVADSNGNTVKLESSGVTIQASAKVTINASQVQLSAGMITIDAGMSKFAGVVQADTVIANSIVATSYTPGAGNIW
jgi:uncharacterized protein involved in type VI secretion and phage assembly